MKLELKHLAPYLPYDLMCEVKDQGKTKHEKLSGAYIDNSYAFFDTVESEYGYDSIKPILRPLSDLPTEKDCWNELQEHCYDIDENLDYICDFDGNLLKTSLSYRAVLILTKYHFDVFGLIEEGLAISYNGLDN